MSLQVDAQTDEKLTIKELICQAHSIAVALLKYGITKDDLFLFNGLNSIPYAVSLLASFFLGNTITTSKPSHNIFEVSNQIANSCASVVFISKALAPITKRA